LRKRQVLYSALDNITIFQISGGKRRLCFNT
jgi:hypothetical protein